MERELWTAGSLGRNVGGESGEREKKDDEEGG